MIVACDITGTMGAPNGKVRVPDLLDRGPCTGFAGLTQVPSREDVIADAGLTEADWDEFMDVLTNGTRYEQDRYICWMERYITQCATCRSCSGSDPFR